MKFQALLVLIAALIIIATLPTYAEQESATTSKVIVIEFIPDMNPLLPTDLSGQKLQLPETERAIEMLDRLDLQLEPRFTRPFTELRQEAASLAGNSSMPDLTRWARVEVPGYMDPESVLNDLLELNNIKSAYIQPQVFPAALFPADTPKFDDLQVYLAKPKTGLGAEWAWDRDLNGKGVTVADIEGDWIENHHDLKALKKTKVNGVQHGSALWYDHGAAEMGIVLGTKNSYGITGIAFKSKPRMFSIWRKNGEGDLLEDTADAISRATAELSAGDIIFMPIEFRDDFTNSQGFAVEYYDDVYEAIILAVAKGIIVVEAAGNGGLNLDSDIFEGAFDRNVRDSGAIIVGAGGATSSMDLRRLSYSNYGSRVDIQNWGHHVVTAGYGDLYYGSKKESYTDSFNGTSSASGLTAGVCALIQHAAKTYVERPLTPLELRGLLVKTGYSQVGANGKSIGPRPNIKKAIRKVKRGKF